MSVGTRLISANHEQGCQMVYFQIENPNLGKFWMELQWKMLVYFMDIWFILRPFGTGMYFIAIWYMYFIAIWYTYCTNKNLATLITKTTFFALEKNVMKHFCSRSTKA
jgi:hypothetical protein